MDEEKREVDGIEGEAQGAKKPILVVGAGIGGLSLALALQRCGLEVRVYEQAEVLRPVGAGLSLWHNAIVVLERMGLLDALKRGSKHFTEGILGHWKGGLLASNPLGGLGGVYGVHRAALHEILLSSLRPGTVAFGARCTGVQQDKDTAAIQINERDLHEGSVVVGADGLHSWVRRSLWGEEKPRFSGYTAFRGIAEVEDLGSFFNGEIWGRGKRFGIVPIQRRVIYWFCTENRRQGQILPASERKAHLLDAFAGWGHGIPRLLQETPAEAILQHDIADHPPRSTWSSGLVTLLGDAIHPTTPNLGQGACQAIESAYILADCLASFPADPTQAFRLYETLRQPRTAWITQTSWKLGKIGQWHNPLAVGLRDLLVRLTPPSAAITTFQKAAGYDATKSVFQALPPL